MKGLSYLHHLLTSNNESFARQVFLEQMNNPVKGDWTTTVQNDLKELNINMSFIDISSISKRIFKNIVKKACKQSAFNHLLEKTAKLSKRSEKTYTKL